MLSDGELKRIAAEEHFRHAIRRSLEDQAEPPPSAPGPPPSEGHGWGGRLYEFLNSSVGMWLLSSVVLTGGAAVIQQVQHNHEIALQNRQALSNHSFEIHHRLDNMIFQLKRAKTVGDAKAALGGILKSPIPLSPELSNRTLASLFVALFPLLQGSEKEKNSQAFRLVKQLEEVELLIQSMPDDQPLDDEQRAKLTQLVAAI